MNATERSVIEQLVSALEHADGKLRALGYASVNFSASTAIAEADAALAAVNQSREEWAKGAEKLLHYVIAFAVVNEGKLGPDYAALIEYLRTVPDTPGMVMVPVDLLSSLSICAETCEVFYKGETQCIVWENSELADRHADNIKRNADLVARTKTIIAAQEEQ